MQLASIDESKYIYYTIYSLDKYISKHLEDIL